MNRPDIYKLITQERERQHAKFGTRWEHVLPEELAGVLAAKTPAEQKTELIQLAAVCVQILEGME